MPLAETALINAGLAVGLFDDNAVAAARVAARQRRMGVAEALAFAQRFPPAALYHAAAQARELPYLHGSEVAADEELLQRLPASLIQRHRLLPVRAVGALYLLTDNPDDAPGIGAFRQALGTEARLAVCDPDLLQSLLNQHLPGRFGARPAGEEGDAVALLDRLMSAAWLRRASDIHVEPLESEARVRLRVDGGLHEIGQRYTPAQASSLVSRIKVLAGMDIAENRATQDGGFVYRLKSWEAAPIEVRAATMPTLHGERTTLRILGDSANRLSLDFLGMPPAMLGRLRETLTRPYGMVLVTGPTGSGKSTTLYAALREIDSSALNVLTVEDPVEQPMAGMSQSPTSQKLSFAAAVRAFLRHDPDVIMVGEIRDGDTADAAIKAAMTGHLVLSTLHTNRAVAAVTRLADIGCERFLVAANLIGVLAQRLARRLCSHCRRPRPASADESRILGLGPGAAQVFEAPGCAACMGTGYAGRVGIYEALWIDDDLAEAIQAGASERELAARARELHTLREDAIDKVRAGVTSFAEVRYLL